MKLAFLATLAAALFAGSASAQYPTYPVYGVSQSYPGVVCPRVASAVSEVRSVLAQVIAPPPAHSQPVYGTWSDGSAGWHVAPPASVPQRMAAPTSCTPPRFPRIARLLGR